MHQYDYKRFTGVILQELDPNYIDTHDYLTDLPGYKNDQKENRAEDGYLYTTDSREGSEHMHSIPVEYRINRHSFRSQHFENFKPEDTNILFAGCSWTHGTGIPENMVWTNVLTNKMREAYPDQKIEPYNIGIGGASIPLIFKNVFAFLRKYPEVDYLYILFPGFDRASRIQDGFDGFKKITYVPPDKNVFKIPIIKRHALNYIPEESMHIMLPMIKAIEDICELRRIKLYWGTWVSPNNVVFETYDFKNYIKLPNWTNIDIKEADPTFFKVAKDGSHPGHEHNIELATAFFEKTING